MRLEDVICACWYDSLSGAYEIPPAKPGDFYYRVELRDVYELCDSIVLNGRELFVDEIETRFEGGELSHVYSLKTRGGFCVPEAFNMAFIGASLCAHILAAEKEVVQIRAVEDENKARAGVRWMPYSTVYSSPNGTGWYCMPEPGEEMRLYFPDEKEKNGYVVSAAALAEPTGNERVNPDFKSIMNIHKKEALFMPDSIVLTNNAGMSVEILDGYGIRILSNKKVNIESGEALDIVSEEENIKLIAPAFIEVEQEKASIKLDDNLKLKAETVYLKTASPK